MKITQKQIFFTLLIVSLPVAPVALAEQLNTLVSMRNDHAHTRKAAHDEHQHEEGHKHDRPAGEHHHNPEGEHDQGHQHEVEGAHVMRVEVSEQVSQDEGLLTEPAGAHELQQGATFYGEIVPSASQLSHVRARFRGMITSVSVDIGDTVQLGDVLAEVESNESLKRYAIRSPIAGRIVQRHANTGEVVGEQVLFSIANTENLWLELRIFPKQFGSISAGMAVEVQANNQIFTATVDHIIPSMEQPFQLARVKLENDALAFSPGQWLRAQILTQREHVALAVLRKAVQELDGKQGVFVKHDHTYEFTQLKLGRSDRDRIEVLEGMAVGDEYVFNNSYLLKADVEKSSAEHQH